MIIANRISYEVYTASYKEGGGLYELYKANGKELPVPLSEAEWIAEQGSIEGPITSWMDVADDFDVPEGWVMMSDAELEKQLSAQTAASVDAEGFTPADGILVCDNFQDGKSKAPFNLQVRNTTGNAVKFIAIVRDAPYSKIPALVAGDYELATEETDAGYTYTFSGDLDGYASITITGGVPSPVGIGKTETSPELYLG